MTVVVNSQQGSASNTTAATTQTITPTGIVAGRSLVLLIGNSGGGTTGVVSGVTDTGGNTWTLPAGGQGGVTGATNTRLAAAYVHNCVAPGTITATMGSIGGRKLLLLEVTGLQNATVHQAVTDTSSGSVSQAQAVAPNLTTSAVCFAIAYHVRNGTSNPTGLTAGWTASTVGLPDNTTPLLRGAFREFAATGATGNVIWTYASSQKFTGAALAFKVTSGTVFTQSLTGTFVPTGAVTRGTRGRTVQATITPSGGISRASTRILTAGALFSGARNAATNRTLTAASVSFSGSLPSGLRQALTAAFRPTGALSRASTRTLTGTLTPTGRLLAPTGYLRSVFTPTGVLNKLTTRGTAFTAAITFTGGFSRSFAFIKSLTGTFTPTGSITRKTTNRPLAGVLAPTGLFNRAMNLTGLLTSAVFAPQGAFSKTTSRALSAVHLPTGALSRATTRSFAAVLTPTGVVAHRSAKMLVGALRAAGSLSSLYIPGDLPLTATVVNDSPGGGGFGAVMSDGFFQRYSSRYKSTLRKQRG